MDIRTKEAIRYLGYGTSAIDEKTMQLIQESFQELEQVVRPRFVYRIFEIRFIDDIHIKIENLLIKSVSLKRNLRGCKKAYLFAATLGIEVDRMMRRYEISDMAKAVVLQACAAAYLEEYCNQRQDELGKTKSRFSPGYGDFEITHQRELLDLLETHKQIGVTLTDGYMLSPTKSITAVIGICE